MILKFRFAALSSCAAAKNAEGLRPMMNESERQGTIRHVPPPVLFLLSYIAGEGLHYIAPLPIIQFVSVRSGQVIGGVFLAVGVLIVLTSVATFFAAKTTVIPYRRAATLVTRGPFRLTRNPMYVGVTLIYLGIAALRGVLWPVLLLPIPLAVLNYVVIPQEESLLRATFGTAYDQYCARVRRWL
jgi:protein-S-isoprenylcysteine O-methyltransferase Ste14